MIFGIKYKCIFLTHTMYCCKYTCAPGTHISTNKVLKINKTVSNKTQRTNRIKKKTKYALSCVFFSIKYSVIGLLPKLSNQM